MNKLDEDKFVAHICDYLDRSIEHLEPSLSTRLDAVRTNALTNSIAERSTFTEDEDLLVDSIVTRLEDQSKLPDDIEKRLDLMRRQAVAHVDESFEKEPVLVHALDWLRNKFDNNLSFPVGMIATACLTVTVVTLFYTSSDPINDFTVDDELVLIASADDLELYENLDFYLWLEETGFEN